MGINRTHRTHRRRYFELTRYEGDIEKRTTLSQLAYSWTYDYREFRKEKKSWTSCDDDDVNVNVSQSLYTMRTTTTKITTTKTTTTTTTTTKKNKEKESNNNNNNSNNSNNRYHNNNTTTTNNNNNIERYISEIKSIMFLPIRPIRNDIQNAETMIMVA